MEEENFQQQQDELCALEAIYAEHFVKYALFLFLIFIDLLLVPFKLQFQMSKIDRNW